ncbi:MAG TPA: HAMP domain-containing sensor histidine kinase, partial [Candidatus Wallbacteria bacterium]|nr:HAMP domain-containing sensor histidine kinase [Candidatus Wallbacteria bacterium]
DGNLGDATEFGEAQKKFVENLRSKNITAIVIYPILKDANIIKYYVIYFRETVKFILDSKLKLIGELITEAELLIDNMDLLKELKNKNELLYDQNIELDAYASTVSHDLKNPLTAVLGYYQMLNVKIGKLIAGGAADASSIGELKEFVEKGYRASNIMKNLIDDILTFSRIKDTSFKIEKFNVGDIFSVIFKLFEDQMRRLGIELSIAEKPPDIYADKNSIERVFTNLVSNSIKYIGQGEGKKINIRWEEDAYKYKFTISDNGIGIAKIYQKNIFTPFYRTKENVGIEGTGLGLAITKKIIEKHGGKIWFESRSLEGSSFYFTIPKSVAPV